MIEINEADIIKLLSKSKTIEILRALEEGDKSFTDLQFELHAQLSTTKRALEALQRAGLIEKKIAKRDNRRVTLYKLTSLGKSVLDWLDEFENIVIAD